MEKIKIPKNQVQILDETEKAYYVKIEYAREQPMNIDNTLHLTEEDCEKWIKPSINFWVPKKLFYENENDYEIAYFYLEKEVEKYPEYTNRILRYRMKFKNLKI